ncbi:MAG: glycosyltransferase family 2 protein [Actinomycetota bacterium]|nr:glycosyltransferase family 2 protein [Actinomycetota bacterium]
MLRVVTSALQAPLLALIAYNTVTALWGWRTPPPPAPGPRRRRFRVVVPAHDEAGVIEGVLRDLAAQDYPQERYRTVVIADRCSDATATVAAGYADVTERRAGAPGKGPAIADHLATDPLADDEALIIIDADNRVPPGLLSRFADELAAGHDVLQAYLDVDNPDASMLAMASAITYWASNRTVQLARRNLGWSADLGGTGTCLTADALAAAGGFGASLTEDQELAARLVLAGRRVTWVHDLRVRDQKPTALAVTMRQRSRWMSGKREVGRRYAAALVRRGLADRSLGPIDVAVRLLQPGRSFVALVSAVLAVAAANERCPLPRRLWGGAAAVQFALPLPFLWRDGVPARYLARYPVVTVLAALWVPIRALSRRTDRWYHTPHHGRSAT